MTAEVVEFPGETTLDYDPDRILQYAMGKLKRVTIVGIDHDGLEYVASSDSDAGLILWGLERAKLCLLRIADDEGDE